MRLEIGTFQVLGKAGVASEKAASQKYTLPLSLSADKVMRSTAIKSTTLPPKSRRSNGSSQVIS